MTHWRKVLSRLGWSLIRLSEANRPPDHLDLAGDREVEWSWIAGNLSDDPGDVLDFGPSSSTSGFIAAFRGGRVIGLDLEAPSAPRFRHPGIALQQGDILTHNFGPQRFDTVINCSTVEHVGLPGRYGSPDIPDGDLKAMARLRALMRGPNARMLMTIPVGIDGVFAPAHRVYGRKRLPALTSGFWIVRDSYFAKSLPDRVWRQVSPDHAFAVQGSPTFYALGLFVLAPA
jgi:Caenorhabditis protein of unknown function, DUF268